MSAARKTPDFSRKSLESLASAARPLQFARAGSRTHRAAAAPCFVMVDAAGLIVGARVMCADSGVGRRHGVVAEITLLGALVRFENGEEKTLTMAGAEAALRLAVFHRETTRLLNPLYPIAPPAVGSKRPASTALEHTSARLAHRLSRAAPTPSPSRTVSATGGSTASPASPSDVPGAASAAAPPHSTTPAPSARASLKRERPVASHAASCNGTPDTAPAPVPRSPEDLSSPGHALAPSPTATPAAAVPLTLEALVEGIAAAVASTDPATLRRARVAAAFLALRDAVLHRRVTWLGRAPTDTERQLLDRLGALFYRYYGPNVRRAQPRLCATALPHTCTPARPSLS